jgi:mannose-6-phosphate isomerase-like protein (cupin superfamily)
MQIIKSDDMVKEILPGRIIRKCVGKDGVSVSAEMTMGFGEYCEEAGPMAPHRHAEEIVYVLSAQKAWVRYGADADALDKKVTLERGMTLHIPSQEWHVFEYEPRGHLDIIFFYGRTENIRPEEG